MQKKALLILIAFIGTFSFGFSQDAVKTVKLEQTPGEFTVKSLTLSAGTYLFEIANNAVDHEVGFVLAPEGKPQQEHHIKAAYVTETVKPGKAVLTSEVRLAKGEYIYFCPLNPTPQYKLTVN